MPTHDGADAPASGKYEGGRPDMVPFLPASTRTVLDIGCGSGAFGAQLLERAPGLELWAVEPDVGGAQSAARSGSYARVVVGGFPEKAGELPEAFFDCIYFNDVLEHVVEPGDALVAAQDLLSERGVVVASIPNVRCLDVVKPLVVGGDWRYEDFGLLDRTHLRFFTRKSMLRLFDEHGFEVRSVQGIHARQGWRVRAVRRLAGARVDEFLFQQYVVVARRRTGATGPATFTTSPAEVEG